MSRHIIFIDPLEKLIPKKDSSLLFAHELKRAGENVSILYKDDLFLTSGRKLSLRLASFDSQIDDNYYLKNFQLDKYESYELAEGDTLHMRLEPPFDLSYMRSLWMLNYIQGQTGCHVINNPNSILIFNEKITSFISDESIDTFIGSSPVEFLSIVEEYRNVGVKDLILKPIDLFQGIGVKKVSLGLSRNELEKEFLDMVEEFKGPVISQPFQNEVISGEVRAIFYKHELVGAIKKTPVKGSYLANIAQGASFERIDLTKAQMTNCLKICQHLGSEVPWVAFDIIGNKISEVNITCPGLLVEVSKALERNLASDIVEKVLQ